nr:immunoglobulin light chain junction region [Macaca mulatta]MOV75136.1 immunoglobulin light chain junction region [Macaca mulatta]MOV75280.1 immunoglobulin light chain junction region [Macaca mulatta]MOV75951.1 immunoglobulin light chain junction region [Macaca mulatta]MOW08541.1 immunoglobulin light chain junction region [Macaca mulatta]
CMQGTQLPFTF